MCSNFSVFPLCRKVWVSPPQDHTVYASCIVPFGKYMKEQIKSPKDPARMKNPGYMAKREPSRPGHLRWDRDYTSDHSKGERTTDWVWGGPIGLVGCIPGKPKLQSTRRDLWVPEAQLSTAQSWIDGLTVGKKQSLHQSLGSSSLIWKVVPGRRREGDRKEGNATKGEVLQVTAMTAGPRGIMDECPSRASEGRGAPIGWGTPQGTWPLPQR